MEVSFGTPLNGFVVSLLQNIICSFVFLETVMLEHELE